MTSFSSSENIIVLKGRVKAGVSGNTFSAKSVFSTKYSRTLYAVLYSCNLYCS